MKKRQPLNYKFLTNDRHINTSSGGEILQYSMRKMYVLFILMYLHSEQTVKTNLMKFFVLPQKFKKNQSKQKVI